MPLSASSCGLYSPKSRIKPARFGVPGTPFSRPSTVGPRSLLWGASGTGFGSMAIFSMPMAPEIGSWSVATLLPFVFAPISPRILSLHPMSRLNLRQTQLGISWCAAHKSLQAQAGRWLRSSLNRQCHGPKSVCMSAISAVCIESKVSRRRHKSLHGIDIGAHIAVVGNANRSILEGAFHSRREPLFDLCGELHRLDDCPELALQPLGQHHPEARLINTTPPRLER